MAALLPPRGCGADSEKGTLREEDPGSYHCWWHHHVFVLLVLFLMFYSHPKFKSMRRTRRGLLLNEKEENPEVVLVVVVNSATAAFDLAIDRRRHQLPLKCCSLLQREIVVVFVVGQIAIGGRERESQQKFAAMAV